jgi:acetate kinase
MRILVVNAGSSSLKLRVLDDTNLVTASVDLPAPGGEPDAGATHEALANLTDVQAIGHRIVHGGGEFTGPVLVDEEVVARLRALSDLAPLHQPTSLAALEVVSDAYPSTPSVACFDTAFHAGLTAAAATYAIPLQWRERWRLRRYGFHGLSHAYASRRSSELLGVPIEELRIVTCHLGAGASLAAVQGGRSVDTTMGFTPLEGLVMATRSGSLDPGLVLWLEEHAGIRPAELAFTLEHRSGLQGLAGTPDMRSVLSDAEAGRPEACLALEVYLHRLRSEIASMTAAMGTIDCLTFTGGVGENCPEIREGAARGLGFLGVQVDAERNASGPPDRDIGTPESRVRTFVIAAREDLQIAEEVRQVLGRDEPRGP